MSSSKQYMTPQSVIQAARQTAKFYKQAQRVQKNLNESFQKVAKMDTTGYTTSTGTQTASKSQGKHTVATQAGRSGGKYYKRSSKRISKPRRARIANGIQFTKEQNGVKTSIDGDSSSPAYIGHYTHDYTLLFKHVFRVMIKAAYAKRGYTITDFSEDAFAVFGADVWAIKGYDQPATIAVTTIGTITLSSATTWESASEQMFAAWDAAKGDRNYFKSFDITGADGTVHSMPMVNLALYGNVKSTLKVQNRTSADSGANTELTTAISSNPIYGYLYRGRGGGTSLKGDRVAAFAGTANTGLVEAQTSPAGISSLSEPPKPATMTRVDRFNKVLMEPSQLKTSVLYAKVATTFQKLYQQLSDYSTTNAKQSYGPGRFALYGLEKMMDEAESPVVTLNFESNWYCNLKCTYKIQKYTNPINDV